MYYCAQTIDLEDIHVEGYSKIMHVFFYYGKIRIWILHYTSTNIYGDIWILSLHLVWYDTSPLATVNFTNCIWEAPAEESKNVRSHH